MAPAIHEQAQLILESLPDKYAVVLQRVNAQNKINKTGNKVPLKKGDYIRYKLYSTLTAPSQNAGIKRLRIESTNNTGVEHAGKYVSVTSTNGTPVLQLCDNLETARLYVDDLQQQLTAVTRQQLRTENEAAVRRAAETQRQQLNSAAKQLQQSLKTSFQYGNDMVNLDLFISIDKAKELVQNASLNPEQILEMYLYKYTTGALELSDLITSEQITRLNSVINEHLNDTVVPISAIMEVIPDVNFATENRSKEAPLSRIIKDMQKQKKNLQNHKKSLQNQKKKPSDKIDVVTEIFYPAIFNHNNRNDNKIFLRIKNSTFYKKQKMTSKKELAIRTEINKIMKSIDKCLICLECYPIKELVKVCTNPNCTFDKICGPCRGSMMSEGQKCPCGFNISY